MEGNTNLHNETEKWKKQVNDTKAAVEIWYSKRISLQENKKTAIENNNNLGVKVKQLENEIKQWLIVYSTTVFQSIQNLNRLNLAKKPKNCVIFDFLATNRMKIKA
jgi:hypothetical protein